MSEILFGYLKKNLHCYWYPKQYLDIRNSFLDIYSNYFG